MSITIVCTCGTKLRAKPELAGKRVKCPSCHEPLAVPLPLAETNTPSDPIPATSQIIRVSGANGEAVCAMREFLGLIQSVAHEANPFRNSKYQISIKINRVDEGSAFLRYLLIIVGTPSVTLSCSLKENDRSIVQETLTSTAFFQDSRDAGFRGGAFGGSNVSFLRTNCRELTRQIVQKVSSALNVSDQDQKELLNALDANSTDRSTLKWMGISAGVLALLFSSLGLTLARPNERIPAIFGGLFGGALFGGAVGFVFAKFAELFFKLKGR